MVALLGSAFMLLDKCIPGMARERSIVAHIRLNSGSQLVSNQAPAIVRLFAATGLDSSGAKPPIGQLTCTTWQGLYFAYTAVTPNLWSRNMLIPACSYNA